MAKTKIERTDSVEEEEEESESGTDADGTDTDSDNDTDESNNRQDGIDKGASSSASAKRNDPKSPTAERQEDDDDDDKEEEEGVENNKDGPKHNDNQNNNEKKKKPVVVFGDAFLSQTENFNVKLQKRGVVYVARVPPRMTPTKIKSLLSGHGCDVTRVYLVEEEKSARQRRKKRGGSGSKRYTEGWVEFAEKRIAKTVARSLNNTPISNYKRSAHYGDLWNLKYLRQFKWSHLTEKVAYERRVREQKLRVEMMQARRENASYVELVETGKKLDQIEERKRRREQQSSTTTSTSANKAVAEEGGGDGTERQPKKRKTRQNRPVDERSDGAAKKALLRALVQD